MIVFKRLYNKIRNRVSSIKYNYSLIKYIKYPKGKKIIVPGTPTHTNIGDSAIVLAQKKYLKSIGIDERRIKEITMNDYYRNRSLLKKYIKKDDIIISLGGGNMGNQWPKEEKFRYDLLKDFPDNRTIIFPQTIFYVEKENDDVKKQIQESVSRYGEKKDLTIIARETESFDIMKSLYKMQLLLCPDIVLSTTMEDYGVSPSKREGILLCTRNDAEKKVPDSDWEYLINEIERQGKTIIRTDMHSKENVTVDNRLDLVKEKMQEFCNSELVVTDRLHGMIFAAITETPCIVFGNYNHKVYGTYKWIDYLPYVCYVENVERAIEHIPALLNMEKEKCKFDNAVLKPYYKRLQEEVVGAWEKTMQE
ncbi:MAG: hypothetical protein E7254_07360 [Lachnospiraceae bacterium]|nr:hypothetical protein [Lachnospiraceae bacterium]